MTHFVFHMKPSSCRVLNPGHVTHERFETESDVVLRFEVFAVRADFGSSSLDLRLRSCSSRVQLSLHASFYSKLCLILCSLMMHFELQQSLLPHTWSVLPYTQLDSVKKKILKAVTKRPVCCRVAVVTVTIVMIVSGCPAASLRLKLQSQFNSMLLCSQ